MDQGAVDMGRSIGKHLGVIQVAGQGDNYANGRLSIRATEPQTRETEAPVHLRWGHSKHPNADPNGQHRHARKGGLRGRAD